MYLHLLVRHGPLQLRLRVLLAALPVVLLLRRGVHLALEVVDELLELGCNSIDILPSGFSRQMRGYEANAYDLRLHQDSKLYLGAILDSFASNLSYDGENCSVGMPDHVRSFETCPCTEVVTVAVPEPAPNYHLKS